MINEIKVVSRVCCAVLMFLAAKQRRTSKTKPEGTRVNLTNEETPEKNT